MVPCGAPADAGRDGRVAFARSSLDTAATALAVLGPSATLERGYAIVRREPDGLIVRSVGLTKGLTGTVRSLKAGEVKEFTEVVDRARHTALERLIDHARQLGGNAVLGVRFDSSDLGNGLAEIVAYGTAATVRPASSS